MRPTRHTPHTSHSKRGHLLVTGWNGSPWCPISYAVEGWTIAKMLSGSCRSCPPMRALRTSPRFLQKVSLFRPGQLNWITSYLFRFLKGEKLFKINGKMTFKWHQRHLKMLYFSLREVGWGSCKIFSLFFFSFFKEAPDMLGDFSGNVWTPPGMRTFMSYITTHTYLVSCLFVSGT